MTGNVFIIGQIGNSYDDNGKMLEKGVELVDVVNQVEPLKDCDIINVWINSPGGIVSVGHEIANYLSKKKNVHTIADTFCASIATEIHLCVPLANRKIVAGTQYMIHNPLFSKIENANAADLKEMASVLEPIQKNLVSMYVKNTGTSKEAIQGLMNVEASLTEEELLTLGFVSEIISKVQLKAVAFIDPKNVNNKNTNMSKIKLGLMQKAMAKLSGREVKAIVEDVTQGTIETPFADLMVGDPIMLGDVPAPVDTYELADGTKLVVSEEGVIGEIVAATGENVEYTELMAKYAALEAENTALKTEAEALKTEKEATASILAEMEAEHEVVKTEMEALANARSKFVVPAATASFRKPTVVATKSTKELMEERKQSYKTK